MRALACVAFVWLLASSASAQPTASLELAVDASASRSIDVDALSATIERELDVTIARVDPATPRESDRTRLTIEGLGATRLRLELVRADGSTLRRTTRLHPDPDERLATLVILAANLVRDEAGELLALLRRPPPDPEPVVVAEVAAPIEETPAPTEEITPVVEAAPPTEPPIEEVVPEEIETPVVVEPPAPSAPRDPFLRMGLNGQVGSVPRGSGYEPAWIAGLEIMATPLPFFAIGVREFGGAYATTGQWYVGAAPYAELAWRFADWGDLHGGLGTHIEYIVSDSYESIGVAPFVLLGARLYADRIFSISLETTLRIAASNTYHAGTELIPQGALLWTGGLSFAFHLS